MSKAKELLQKMETSTQKFNINDKVVASNPSDRFGTISGRITEISGRNLIVLTSDNKKYNVDSSKATLVKEELKVGDKVKEKEWSGQYKRGQLLYVVHIDGESVGINPDKNAKPDDKNTLYGDSDDLMKV